MIKFYKEKSSDKKQPREETIQFLLNYSKSLKVVNLKNEEQFELHLN